MPLKVLRFFAVMLAALTLGMGFCHLMELPARMAWDQYLWVGSTVQGGLYRMFGTLGAVIDVAAVIMLIVLSYMVRQKHRGMFQLTALAAALYVLALALWWAVVFPVNVELAKWVNGPVPANWLQWRARWEWGHAFNTLLQFIGFAALIWSMPAQENM